MYEYLKGELAATGPLHAIVDVKGVGYKIAIPLRAHTALPPIGSSVQFFLSFVVKEDSHTLYGFLSMEERDLFESLKTVSGIGPKTALALIGHLEISAFESAIASGNTLLLAKVPGIGKKTAERLVMEMKDKCIKGGKGKGALAIEGATNTATDAIHALIHLGYNPLQAQRAVQKALEAKKGDLSLSTLIAAALQKV